MNNENLTPNTANRRGFLKLLATGAAAFGIGTALKASPGSADLLDPKPAKGKGENEADKWFNKVTGKRRMVFDATRPHEVLPFAWPKVFLLTNEATGTPTNQSSVVVVLRHEAIPYAFESRLWEKYKFGEMFKAMDPKTEKPSTRNPFWQPAKGDFKIPGIGEVEIGIDQLQAQGVMFCVCHAAMTVYSAVAADMMKMDAAEVMKDWMSGVLPGIQVVPSGVWALGRAQEHKCSYVFAG